MLKGLCCVWVLWSALSHGATKVGNGDDGADLEGGEPIASGPIVEARQKAVARLETLGVRGVSGLGALIPEVERTRLVMAREDVEARVQEDEGPFHVNFSGKVYARTFAEPHAATRFFPAALKLDEEQLVALHIHEGLHRALPESVREDESVVAEITLALTAADTTQDRIRRTVEQVAPEATATVASSGPQVPEVERFKKPSEVSYRYINFRSGSGLSSFPVGSLHSIRSDLYPFGGLNSPLGLGVEASLISDEKGSHLGPLGLSLKLRAWSRRDFAVGVWASASLNTLSADELKQSPFGRDVLSVGVSLRKDLSRLYVENRVGYSFAGQAMHRVGLLNYQYGYGGVWEVLVRSGARLGPVDLGVFAQIHLADRLEVSGGAFRFDSGRYRLVSAGPEVGYRTDDFHVALFGRFLVDSTKGANFDYLGNLLGVGVARGGVGASLGIFF